MSRSNSTPSGVRFEAVDALRGLAMVWMTVFHFCFDLNQFGYSRQDFYRDPFWTTQRTLIVSLFLLCAGMGQAIALAQRQSWQRFWRRWARVVGAALLVTVGSWWMYPQSFIYFGVLHGIALMLIVLRLTVRWRAGLWLLGAAAIAFKLLAVYALETGAAPLLVDALNSRALNWLGLMWWGGAIGSWLSGPGAALLKRPLPAPFKPLALLGRWSLSYYLLHQPVMIGALMALGWVLGR